MQGKEFILMANWKEISAEDLQKNPFTLIGKDWGLVTAGTKERVNTMTVSWGGVGIMYGKPVAYLFIRPQRFTKQLIDANDTLTLSFYDDSQRKMLSYMGSHSGKDEDKVQKMNLTVAFDNEAPYFEEANLVLSLKKVYEQDMTEKGFYDAAYVNQWYAQKDFHVMYICEITKVLIKA